MLKGADTEAAPVTVPVRVLVTVKVWVAEVPMVTLPKFTVAVGVAVMSTWVTALATLEHALFLLPVFSAVIAML